MLDISFIRDHAELVEKNAKNRGVAVDIDSLLKFDDRRRQMIVQLDGLRAQRNAGSKTKPSAEDIERMRNLGDEIASREKELTSTEAQLQEVALKIPNLTHPDTPIGGEEDFKVLFVNREPKPFDFAPKDHEQLFLDHDLIDFERATKVSGSKFYYAKNDLVRLNQALIAYGLDVATRHGYALMETPDMARNEILQGIGFAPRGPESQVYSLEGTDLSMIGTAEITIGGYHAGEILDLADGPKKYAALSHCFRTEAGAYGRVSKGLYRVHQFTKLELFIFCKPEDSERMHQELLNVEKEIVDGLDIPYRVIDIASGDLGGPAYRKFDIEAWMTMRREQGRASTEASRPNVKGGENTQGGYGEITSTSNTIDYQARRLNIRYRISEGKTEFVHTLNGTAITTSRLPIAIAENYQTSEGNIRTPDILKPYLNSAEYIGPKYGGSDSHQ